MNIANNIKITDDILDILGFTEYWDENGSWGGRILKFKDGQWFQIIQSSEDDFGKEYKEDKYSFAGWFANPKIDCGSYDLETIGDMTNCILEQYPNYLKEFKNLLNNKLNKEQYE